MIEIETADLRVVVNPEGGHLDEVVFRTGGRELRPMHRAPWRTGEDNGGVPETLPEDVPVVLRSLAGDFLCAPFSTNDLTGGPSHGEPANGPWRQESAERLPGGGVRVRLGLVPRVMGATVTKEITLRPGHPVVYQRHVFAGGAGALPVAHHAMIRATGGVELDFSPKAFGATPPRPLETDPAMGRFVLAYPQRFASLSAVRLADGGTADASRYPYAENHEDFLLLAEAPGRALGWSAALARADGWLYFAVRDARQLPFTLLWMSNGGRHYAPWSDRHRRVLGIEDGCTLFGEGHRASTAPNALTEAGYRTALTLDAAAPLTVSYAFGALPAEGWERIASIEQRGDGLVIADRAGRRETVPFEAGFLDGGAG